jgi:uncharacterized protein YaeQ
MALKATIHRVELQVSDIDHHHYAGHSLTVARHPSETEERMMVRVLVFALHAHEGPTFGRGISSDEDPDLWCLDATGAVRHWIDLGLPDERRLRRAAGRASAVSLYTYGARGVDVWWKQNGGLLAGLANLAVWQVPFEASQALAKLAGRTMRVNCTIQEGQIWLGDESTTVPVELRSLKATAER